MLRNTEFKQPETVRARRPPLPGARWPSRSLARRIALVQGNARQGPPTLWHQCQLVQDPLSLELNRRLVAKSRHSEVFSAVNASVGPPHFFVISSNLTTINTRTIGSVLTLHRHFHLSPLDPRLGSAKGARQGPLTLWHKLNADGPFHPSGSWRGQRSGAGPCFRDAGPGSRAKTSARRSAVTRTGRLRPASEDVRARTGSVGSALSWASLA